MKSACGDQPVLNSFMANYNVTNTSCTDYSNKWQPEEKIFQPLIAARRVSEFTPNHLDTTNEVKGLKQEVEKLNKIIKELKTKGAATVTQRRLVKVLIVDPNENLSLEKAVLVNEAEKLTDLDDNEIFFDMDIKDILAKHNKVREGTIDKKASKNKDKDIFLDAIKIRDLNMSVITIATI